MKAIVLHLIFLLINVYASVESCRLDFKLNQALALTEMHPKKGVNYPFLISLNNKSEAKIIKELLPDIQWLDNRTIDCLNQSNCIELTKILIDNEIDNLDLGHMQLNYYWHKNELNHYFDIEKSNEVACDILYHLEKRYGWSWETIGKYHNYKKSKNRRYIKKVKYHYANLGEL